MKDTFNDREKANERYDSPELERREGPVDDLDYDSDGGYEMDGDKRYKIVGMLIVARWWL